MAGSAFNYIKNNFPSIAKRALDVVSPSLGTATSLLSQNGGQALSDINNIPQNTINNGKQAFSTMATGLNNGVTATNPASLIAGSMKLGAGGAQLVGSIPMSILQPALTLSGIPQAMESASNFGTDNPTYQNFAQSNIGTGARNLVDFINDSAGVFGTVAGAGFGKGGKIANTVKPLAQDVLPPPGGGGGSIQLSTPDTQFASHLNKAFNLNKKEISQGDSLMSNAKKVFSDISANKDTNGILDTHGNIKEPTQYSYQDTLDATKTRMPEVYKSYTSQLNGIDREMFDASIRDSIASQKSALDAKIAIENSLPDRNAMTRLSEEIGSLRDTSPIGMQDYLQKLGVRSKPVAGVMTPENIQTSNLAGVIRDALDKAATEVGNTSYSADRSLYAAYKSVQDMFLRGAVKEIKNTPGMGERLANMGVTVEGLQFILTHDPHSLVIAAGLKGGSKFASFLNSPLRSLSKLYQSVENQSSSRPLPLIPDITSQSAPTINSNSIISSDNTIQTPRGTPMEMGTYKFAPNPSTGRAELTGQYRPPNVNFYPPKKTVPISNNTNTPAEVPKVPIEPKAVSSKTRSQLTDIWNKANKGNKVKGK
jgi:hypothetical protein